MEYPIRILQIFTVLNHGGAETMVMNYYRQMDRTKVQFDFMVHREEKGTYEDEIEALGGKIYRMMPIHPFTFRKYQQQIAEFFDKYPEYTIIHSHLSELGYFIYKEAFRRKIPHVYAHAHSSDALWDSKWLIRTYFKHASRKYISQGFACSEQAAHWLLGKHWNKALLLQKNAIDTERFQFDDCLRKQYRQSWGIIDDCMVIGHVGSLTEIKNHQFLITVFHQLHRNHPNSRLVLVGNGWLEEKLKRQVLNLSIQDAVIFLGDRSDVNEILNSVDVFVLPSISEGFSMATLEAQCNGLPCLVSDTLPKEVRITPLVHSLSLKHSIKEWVQKIMELYTQYRNNDRTIHAASIIEAGYDIQDNARWLQHYYLNL